MSIRYKTMITPRLYRDKISTTQPPITFGMRFQTAQQFNFTGDTQILFETDFTLTYDGHTCIIDPRHYPHVRSLLWKHKTLRQR